MFPSPSVREVSRRYASYANVFVTDACEMARIVSPSVDCVISGLEVSDVYVVIVRADAAGSKDVNVSVILPSGSVAISCDSFVSDRPESCTRFVETSGAMETSLERKV